MFLIYYTLLLSLINITLFADNNNFIMIKKKSQNNYTFIIKENKREDCLDDKAKKEIKYEIEWIFIHGSTSGMHTYAENPGKSVLGLVRNIREVFFRSKDFYKELCAPGNKEKQFNYKSKKNLFLNNKLPLIMGPYFGYYEINNYSNNISNHITEEAFKYILNPFKKNAQKYSLKNNFSMFNWTGDLNQSNRDFASEQLSQYINENNKQNIKKYIFMGFSHGGNVMINAINNIKNKDNIRYVIFLGTPIGKKTIEEIKKITNNKFKIINIYSNNDMVQNKDFTMDGSFPKREIENINQKNIINIEIKYENSYGIERGPSHEELYLQTKKGPPLIILIPKILQKIEEEDCKK